MIGKARWPMMIAAAVMCSVASARPAKPTGTPVDHAAIEQLLATYTRAVSSRDQALFETILLDPAIPFAYVGATLPAGTAARSVEQYDVFRKGVFEGAPFVQTFDHVRIKEDGALAQASMIFHNRSGTGASWGFKTMQLLKVGGVWKIASEFFTVHEDAPSGSRRGTGR